MPVEIEEQAVDDCLERMKGREAGAEGLEPSFR
jgi:hypothetical protein